MKVRTDARREHILAVATQVFLESGYARASMSDIAQRMGGSKATLYGYFESKEALFLAVIHAEAHRHLAAAEEELASSRDGDLRRGLTMFGVALVGFVCSDLGCATFRMVLAEAGHSDMGRLFYEEGPLQGTQKMAAVLKRAMDRGELREADPFIAAQQLAGLLTSEVQHRWYLRDTKPLTLAQISKIAERSVDVFLRAHAR